MKTGKLFWGFFLLTLGALFLLTKYEIIQSSFGFVWDLWPLIFVFWGALVIFKESVARPVISAVFGTFIALLLFGIIDNGIGSIDFSEHPGAYTEFYSEEFDGSTKTADLEINAGAGMFIIRNSTDKLAEGKSKGSFAEYDFETWKDGNNASVTFDLHKKNLNFFRGRLKNQLEIALNPNPVWNIRFNIGASKSNFDLSECKVKNVELHTGAATGRLKIGDKYDSTDVHIEMGAATVNVEVPSSSGCSITSDMALSSRDFPGFKKKYSGYYESENFDSAQKKIFIHVNGGFATIRVVRY
jgi:hypothetical protein